MGFWPPGAFFPFSMDRFGAVYVGFAGNGGSVKWTPEHGYTEFAPPEGTRVQIEGCSPSGLSAGWARPYGSSRAWAVAYDRSMNLRPLELPGADLVFAQDVSDSGQAVGFFVYRVGGANRGVVWSPSGQPTFVAPPSGLKWLELFQIDASDRAYGMAGSLSESRTFRLRPGGAFENVPPLAGVMGYNLRDVNDLGYMAHLASFWNGREAAAITRPDLSTVLLQDLVVDPGGWDLRAAEAMNNKGQVVGWGYLNGVYAGYIATPRSLRAVPAFAVPAGGLPARVAPGTLAEHDGRGARLVPGLDGTAQVELEARVGAVPHFLWVEADVEGPRSRPLEAHVEFYDWRQGRWSPRERSSTEVEGAASLQCVAHVATGPLVGPGGLVRARLTLRPDAAHGPWDALLDRAAIVWVPR